MPPVYSGIRLLLVAKSNLRYHRTGIAVREALQGMDCEVAWVAERTRGGDSVLRRSLPSRLATALKRHRPDRMLICKGATLDPELIGALRAASAARWVNWRPDSPHLLGLSLRIGRAYDRCFRFDIYVVERHRALGRNAECLGLGFDPACYRPLPDPRVPRAGISFVGTNEPYIHQFFGEPAEGGRYGTGAERRAKAARLLEAPEAARAIGQRGRARAVQEHAWRHRLDELLTGSLQ